MASKTSPRESADYGCDTYGHLVSPFVDGELSPADRQKFVTRMETCSPCHCKRLIEDYRSIEAALPPVPDVSEERWEAAWAVIGETIRADREAEGGAVIPFLRRSAPSPRPRRFPASLRPLAYAAAAVLLVAVMLRIPHVPGPASTTAAAVAPADPTAVTVHSIACQAPDYIPVVYTTADLDPTTIISCAFVGAES